MKKEKRECVEEWLEITTKKMGIEVPSTRITQEDLDRVQKEYDRSFPAWQKEHEQKEHEPDWIPDC